MGGTDVQTENKELYIYVIYFSNNNNNNNVCVYVLRRISIISCYTSLAFNRMGNAVTGEVGSSQPPTHRTNRQVKR